jgi:hypothetical protein
MKKFKLLILFIFSISISCSLNAQTLTTLFASNNSFAGNTFDITATNTITINSFDVNIDNFGVIGTVEVYYRIGSAVGVENDPNAWTLLGSSQVISAGLDNPTNAAICGLTIPAGQTYGIYVNLSSYPSHKIRYTNGGPNVYSNADIQLTTNTGQKSPAFSGSFKHRQWNGNINYTLGGGAQLSINNVTKAEGNWWGVTIFKFDVTRSGTTDACSVDYSTADGSATTADNDYNTLTGTLHWSNGGSDVKSIWVAVRKDIKGEPDENFFVNLSNPVNCCINDGTGEGTILNDDGAPLIGNNDPTHHVYENNKSSSEEVSIFPNPSKSDIKVIVPQEWAENHIVKASIFNNLGQLVNTLNLSQIQGRIDISNLPQGVYNLVILNADGQKTAKKFLKID